MDENYFEGGELHTLKVVAHCSGEKGRKVRSPLDIVCPLVDKHDVCIVRKTKREARVPSRKGNSHNSISVVVKEEFRWNDDLVHKKTINVVGDDVM